MDRYHDHLSYVLMDSPISGILCFTLNRDLQHSPTLCTGMVVLAGLALRTDEFFTAFQKVYFNAFVQVFNYGVVSSIVFGFSRLMVEVGAISKVLGDGMAISGCLPITVNMCIVLTKAAGGGKSLTRLPAIDDAHDDNQICMSHFLSLSHRRSTSYL